jgi:hypothetical protein
MPHNLQYMPLLYIVQQSLASDVILSQISLVYTDILFRLKFYISIIIPFLPRYSKFLLSFKFSARIFRFAI